MCLSSLLGTSILSLTYICIPEVAYVVSWVPLLYFPISVDGNFKSIANQSDAGARAVFFTLESLRDFTIVK